MVRLSQLGDGRARPVRADAPTGIGISFFTASGLYSDPCHWDVQGTGGADVGDVAVGPTVDDMVAALRANTYYTLIGSDAGDPRRLRRPGVRDPAAGRSVHEVRQETRGTISGHAFVFSGPGLYAQGPANRWHLYILDVAGTRLISVVLSYPKTPKADLDLAQNVIKTMNIET